MTASHNPKLMIELLRDDFRGPCIGVEVRLLASDFQMSAAREVAINILFAHDLLNQIN